MAAGMRPARQPSGIACRGGHRHRQASCRSRRRMKVTEAMSEITVITTDRVEA